MKLNILFILATLLLSSSAAFSNVAFSADNVLPAVDQSVTPVELGEDVNNLVFTGTVKRIPNGTALVTQNGTYLLAGGNFDGIVDSKVNIIGKLFKEGSIEIINVARAQLAQD